MLALWPQDGPSRNQTPHITKACHSHTSVLMAPAGAREQGRSSQLPQLNYLVCKMKMIMFYPLTAKGLKLGKFYELEPFSILTTQSTLNVLTLCLSLLPTSHPSFPPHSPL